MTFEERITKLNDIDQEFENDVLRGFGDALELIDDLYSYVKSLSEKLSDAIAERDSNKELLLEANNSIETIYMGKILSQEARIKELEKENEEHRDDKFDLNMKILELQKKH